MFTTVTQVICQPGRSSDVTDLCLSLLKDIRKEPGCVSVDLYADSESSDLVVFIASWQDEASWQVHITSPRQRELAEQADSPAGKEIMAGWKAQRLHKIAG